MNYILLAALLVVGIIDVYLAATKQRTISQAYQYLLPPALDWMVFAGGLTFACLAQVKWPELNETLLLITMAFWGHCTAGNRERYGEK